MAHWSCVLAATLSLLVVVCESQNTYQSRIIQFKMGPFISCNTWTSANQATIQQFMLSSLLNNINLQCRCNFNVSQLSLTTVLCHPSHSNYPTFRTTITTINTPVATITDYVEDWVLQNSAVSDGIGYYEIDSSCPVFPSSNDSPACPEVRNGVYSSAVLVGALIAEFVILMVVFCIIMAIVLSFYSYRIKKTNFALKRQLRKRLNSTQSRDSFRSEKSHRYEKSYRPDATRIDMQSCQAYVTSI